VKPVTVKFEGCTRSNSVGVVGDARTVRGADFTQPRATLLHDFRDTEAVADFDQLTARNDHLTAARQGRQRNQHRRGTIVHHNGCFR
jgi:hypothetical protein